MPLIEKDMRNLRSSLAVALDRFELAVNLALLAFCWAATVLSANVGSGALAQTPDLPRSLEAVWALLSSADVTTAILSWSTAALAYAVAVGFGLSAIHGTWWTLRRMTRSI